jgi:hypothetical protein
MKAYLVVAWVVVLFVVCKIFDRGDSHASR